MKLRNYGTTPPDWADDPIEGAPFEAPRHRIDAGGGSIRVLRLAIAAGRAHPLSYTVARGEHGVCRVCGCTDRYACPGGCGWVDRKNTLCSKCFEKELLS